jgi:hypothetical protein
VIAPNKIKIKGINESKNTKNSQLKEPTTKKKKNPKRKNTSPTRFIKTVTKPDSILDELE